MLSNGKTFRDTTAGTPAKIVHNVQGCFAALQEIGSSINADRDSHNTHCTEGTNQKNYVRILLGVWGIRSRAM